MKTEYVLGLLFDDACEFVATICKNKPAWQRGLLNGIGGKVETGESCFDAMVREFKEEAGVTVKDSEWFRFCIIEGFDFKVVCFKAFSSKKIWRAQSKTDEQVEIHTIHDTISRKCVSNLPWLIHMALDESHGGQPFHAVVTYK